MEKRFGGLKHILRAQDFSRKWIEEVLFPKTDEMEARTLKGDRGQPLFGKEMISLFAGESLRTRASFNIAMKRLGGEITFETEDVRKFSSMAKGESLEDTIITLNEYGADVIVLRYDEEGGAERAAAVSDIPIINAGDGGGQHPTQALLDLYVIQKHLNRIDGISIAMIGDLEKGRTVHSLAYLFGKFDGVKIYFVSPDNLKIKPDIKEYLNRHNVRFFETKDVREVASKVDVFYQTRTQTNLGTKPFDRADEKNGFTVINKQILDLAKKDSIILHPLPCTDEIVRSEVDPDRRAVYIKTKGDRMSQVKGGIYIRMAILWLLL
ncbi:MAG: aspartate carbamoyltransferase [Candidatus Staskawiczbacteria bacterium]|nr:aspartate carbamoyltransferase [Candidatus Staskawiczbacteria bacterium]